MKTTHTKSIMLLVSAALLLTASIVGTLAYLTDNSGPVTNQFDPDRVPIEVEENFSGTTRSNETMKNNGNIPAYIRAAIVVNWVRVDEKGNVTGIYGEAPKADDHTITINDKDWSKSGDYYYYKGIVAANDGSESNDDLTAILIESASVKSEATIPDGYQLSVEILAQSIQAEPADAVQEAWDMTYDSQSKTWSVKQ